jgi:hypothetical protein
MEVEFGSGRSYRISWAKRVLIEGSAIARRAYTTQTLALLIG